MTPELLLEAWNNPMDIRFWSEPTGWLNAESCKREPKAVAVTFKKHVFKKSFHGLLEGEFIRDHELLQTLQQIEFHNVGDSLVITYRLEKP